LGALRVAPIILVLGDPASEILKKMDELKCDILMIETHGKGFLERPFLGSVSEKILHRARKLV
jgi:nucleotide-binding universal stress UspA family protein